MNRCIIVLAIFILFANVTIENSLAQSVSVSSAGSPSTEITSSETNAVKIIGIDSTAFPKIKVNVFSDKPCASNKNLKRENFRVEEDDENAVIGGYYYTGNAAGQQLDLAVIFDDTGSMSEEIDAMKSKVKDLTDTIKNSGIDANYALISFNDNVSIRTTWTNDTEILKKCVNSLQAMGGADEPEVSLDAIEAALTMGFRPDAQKIVIAITDSHAHYENDNSTFSNYTQDDIEKELKRAGIIFIPISPKFEKPSKYADLRAIAIDIQGKWIDLNSAKFSKILGQSIGIITGNYVIEYQSPSYSYIGNKTVTINVSLPECIVGRASGFYDGQEIVAYWYNRGIALANQSKYDEALKAFDKAIELEPNYAEAWCGKGRALDKLGKYDEALKAFDKAIELEPNYAEAWSGKSSAFYHEGKYFDAAKALQNFSENMNK